MLEGIFSEFVEPKKYLIPKLKLCRILQFGSLGHHFVVKTLNWFLHCFEECFKFFCMYLKKLSYKTKPNIFPNLHRPKNRDGSKIELSCCTLNIRRLTQSFRSVWMTDRFPPPPPFPRTEGGNQLLRASQLIELSGSQQEVSAFPARQKNKPAARKWNLVWYFIKIVPLIAVEGW